MDVIRILIQGSQAEPYEVSFKRVPNGAIVKCTCQAGKLVALCKHKVALLQGDMTDVIDGGDALSTVLAWVVQSPIVAAMAEYTDSERTLDAAKVRNATAKKALAKAMIKG